MRTKPVETNSLLWWVAHLSSLGHDFFPRLWHLQTHLRTVPACKVQTRVRQTCVRPPFAPYGCKTALPRVGTSFSTGVQSRSQQNVHEERGATGNGCKRGTQYSKWFPKLLCQVVTENVLMKSCRRRRYSPGNQTRTLRGTKWGAWTKRLAFLRRFL